MLVALLDRLGDWNAQLFRELKGRLTRRNLFAVTAASLIGQVLLVAVLSQNKCVAFEPNSYECVKFEWHIHWQIAYLFLGWLLPLILLVGGVHNLVIDLAKEERRGTLNFIRLSPQSSQNILAGKILGTPALLYIAVALALPLHGWSGLVSGISLGEILACYTLAGAGCCLCYVAALLLTILSDAQVSEQSKAWGCSLAAGGFGLCYISAIAGYHSIRDWQWFSFPLGRQPLLAYIWMMLTVCTAIYWMWQAANRHFRNPHATWLSKPQSYWLVASFQVWLLGVLWPLFGSTSSDKGLLYVLMAASLVNLFGFLFLIGALSPRRQALQDWARYRHQNNPALRIKNAEEILKYRSDNLARYSLIKDLIWSEKSPAIVAIALNLAIAQTVWAIPATIFIVRTPTKIQAFVGLLLSANLILIYALLAQIILLIKAKKPEIWASNVLILAMGLPPIFLGMLSIHPAIAPAAWLFSVFPWVALQNASAMAIFLAFLGQVSVLGLLSFKLTRQLQKAGESTSKPLIAGSN